MDWRDDEIAALRAAAKQTKQIEDRHQRWNEIASLAGNGRSKKECHHKYNELLRIEKAKKSAKGEGAGAQGGEEKVEERPADMGNAAAPAAGQGMEAARALKEEQEDKRKTNMGARPHEDCSSEGAQEQPLIKQVLPKGNGEHTSAAAESIYLQSVLRDNAFIRDGLSGEQLDIRGQCVSVGPDTRTITKESLGAFLQKHAPQEVSQVDELLANCSVGELIKRMEAFGEAPVVTSIAAEDSRVITRESLEAFFQKHKANWDLDYILAKWSVDKIIQEMKARFGAAPEITSTAKEAVEYVQSKLEASDESESVLLTGPAACGKSTLTKQYMYRTASAAAAEDAAGVGMVPVLVPVIELAKTMQEQSLYDANADILEAHLKSKHAADASFLLQMRADHRLLVLLDGMDEAGNCRAILEQYVSKRLATEVKLCVTGREQGIEAMELFSSFVHVQVQPLTERQQAKMIQSRMESRMLEGASVEERAAAFTKQLRGNVSFAELAKNPLLLNLLVSEYMQHERVGGDNGNIYFEGRCVFGQKEYVGSFPGECKREWDRVTQVMKDRSVACVFIPEEDKQYGEHDEDPEEPGKCFCESYLYKEHWPGKEKEFILDESNMHIAEGLPTVGNKVELIVQLPKWNDQKWWVCTVQSVEPTRVEVSFDGLGRVKEPAWVPITDINQTGERKTKQRPLQAPFGCRWYAGWTRKVRECEQAGQKAIIVYKKGQRGNKTRAGLGNSQLKEVAYLEKRYYPNKDYIEIDATEFEAQNMMNRAQIYESAIEGMLKQQGDERDIDNGSDANAFLELLLPFMHELAFHLHTREGGQFRSFCRNFLEDVLFDAETSQQAQEFKAIWTDRLLPAVRASQFPLIVWEPEGNSDVFRISHLSFQEYLCASRLVKHLQQGGGSECAAFVQGNGLEKIEALLGSDRFQVIVQMGRELLANDEALAETFANCFLPKSKDATIRVEQNLSTATAAITLVGLVSCRSDIGIKLQLAKSGLNADAIGGWHSCLQHFGSDAARASLASVIQLHAGLLSSLNISGCGIGAKYIAAAVPKCKALTSLDLASNNLGAEGAKHVAEAIKVNLWFNCCCLWIFPLYNATIKGALENLHIGSNGIPIENMNEIIAIVEAKPTMKVFCGTPFRDKTITELDVSGKSLGVEGAVVIRRYLENNGALSKLIFGDAPNEDEYSDSEDEEEKETWTPAVLEVGMTEADLSNKNLGVGGAIIVGAWISHKDNGALTSLNLSKNALYGINENGIGTYDASGVTALADAIGKHQALTSLNLADNWLESKGAKHVAEAIKVNHSPEQVDDPGVIAYVDHYNVIELKDISQEHFGQVPKVTAIPKAKGALAKLDISKNALCAAGGTALAEGLKDNQIITELKLADNSLGKVGTGPFDRSDMSGVVAIADAIPTMGALTALDLSSNDIGPEGAKHIAEAVKGHGAMKKLTISGDESNWSDDSRNSKPVTIEISMTEADFSGKILGVSGAIMLAAFLPKCRAIATVNILGNKIGKEQLSKLQEIMQIHPTLVSLCGIADDATEANLSGLKMDVDDAVVLADELPAKGALVKLIFGGDKYYDSKKRKDVTPEPAVLEVGMTEADLSNKNLGAGGAVIVGAWISHKDNGALTSLNMSSNEIGKWDEMDGIKALAEAIKVHLDLTSGSTAVVYGYSYYNTTKGALVQFTISDNDLCAAGGKVLAEALKGNQIMTELNIASNFLGKNRASEYNADADMSGIIAISDAIRTMGAMTTLDISNNNIGKIPLPQGWEQGSNKGDGRIIFRPTGGKWQWDPPDGYSGKPDGVIALADAIKNNGALSKLIFGGDKYDDWSTGEKKEITPESAILEVGMKEADLSNKNLGAGGAIIVGAWISHKDNGALASLDLSQNKIPAEQLGPIKTLCESKQIALKA
eukprot:g1164.t1